MASTSSPNNSRKYEVFLSFRGADTRYNFTSHLYHALCKEGINAFMDKQLRRGEEISSTLFQVIESCCISIVIFSQNYASSKFCLDELVKIIDCKTFKGQTVYPVFHNVDPFEVEKQTGRYGTALSDLEAELKGKMRIMRQWKSALALAADLSGWDLRNRDETEVIQEIVQEVLRKLNRKIVEDDLKKLDEGQSRLTDLYASDSTVSKFNITSKDAIDLNNIWTPKSSISNIYEPLMSYMARRIVNQAQKSERETTNLKEKVLVLLRDGRKLLGILRSSDQFGNVVLEGACERVIVGELYCDIPLGLYVIRGENVVLIGELDLEREELPAHMTRVSAAEITRAQKAKREATNLKGTMRKRMEFLDLD